MLYPESHRSDERSISWSMDRTTAELGQKGLLYNHISETQTSSKRPHTQEQGSEDPGEDGKHSGRR